MALCSKLLALTIACAGLSGGVSRIWLFDGMDFDFTQAAFNTTTGHQPYTAVAYTPGALLAGGYMFPLQFERNEAEFRYKQSRKGSNTKYELETEFKTPDVGQNLLNWNYFLDAAGVCCGVGIIVQLNTGRMLVMGERVVNGDPIDIPVYMAQDGSSGGSGKLMDDFNGQTTILKGDSKMLPIEYTGLVADIIALEP